MPKTGHTWFRVDKHKTFDDLVKYIVEEDSSVQNCEYYDENFNHLQNTNSLKIFDALTNPNFQFYLKLNDCLFGFDTPEIDVKKEVAKMKKVSHFIDLNVPTMVDSIKQALAGINDECHSHVANSSLNIQKSFVQHKIEYLNEKRALIVKRIEELQEIQNSIDRKAQFKTNVLFKTFFTLCFTEFLVGYYCIYQVSWLGWDLVEPFTYSIAQFKFALGTWFYCKYMSDVGANDLNSFFVTRFRNRMIKKLRFESDRLEYLQEQLEALDNEIENIEKHSY